MTFALSPNLYLLFSESGTEEIDRIPAVAAAGYRDVDVWGWQHLDRQRFRRVLDEHGVSVRVITAAIGELGDRAALPATLEGLAASRDAALELGCPWIVVTGGSALEGVAPSDQRAAIVEALRQGADVVAGSGVVILLENLNTKVDHVGAFLDTTAETLAIVREVGRPEVRVLWDAYHALMMGESIDEIAGSVELVAHVQIADIPGRGEPGSGDLDWAEILRRLWATGYRGALGLECFPTTETLASLAHIREEVDRLGAEQGG